MDSTTETTQRIGEGRAVVGVLALQGAFREHRRALEAVGAESREVRLPGQLEGLDALIIPGGESTTIGKLAVEWKLLEPMREFGRAGKPIMGTCAGAILLARHIEERGREMDQPRLGLMDVRAVRNAFGRQRDSFEADLQVKGFDAPLHAVFIRAPLLIPESPDVEVPASVDGRAVFIRQGRLLALSFHPELTADVRVHKLFVDMIV